MDPAARPLVATYSTLTGTEGGAVFDAGDSRFLATEIDRLDNRRYVGNIADWLEQNSSSKAKGQVLALDLSDGGSGIDCSRLLSKEAAAERDFRCSSRSNIPALTTALLDRQSQIWLFFGSGGSLAEAEIKALTAFNRSGGALLIVAGEGAGSGNINRLATQFGVTFYGSAQQESKIPVAVAAPLFYRAAEVIGRVLRLTHKA
jgi:hypothetical protein